jgi:predicted nucleic acid-binding protein
VSAGLLDTSTVIGGLPAAIREQLPELLAVSVMTLGELHAGVLVASHPQVRAARLTRLGDVQREFAILDVDPRVAQVFGELRARSGRRAVADLLIAATALANGMLLVTRDERQASLLGDQALLAV